jgi:hypothetical protein
LKKSDDRGFFIEALLIDLPGLKGSSGNLELLGGLTLRQALGSQLTVLLKQVSPFEPIPMGLAIIVALRLGWNNGTHGPLLGSAFAG